MVDLLPYRFWPRKAGHQNGDFGIRKRLVSPNDSSAGYYVFLEETGYGDNQTDQLKKRGQKACKSAMCIIFR